MKHLISSIGFLTSIILLSCSEEAPYVITCADGAVAYRVLSPFDNPWLRMQNVPRDDRNPPVNLIIQSDAEYYKYLTGAY